jgi:ArsR family transcriptional regulator
MDCIKGDVIEELKGRLPVEEELQDLAEFFRVFGDPTRLKILSLLGQGEYCVHDIAAVTGMQQTAISHQLKMLRQIRLVRYRKEGKNVCYTLCDEHINEIFATGMKHVKELS